MPNATTDSIAALDLSAYEKPLAVTVIPSGQDWARRQQIQYAALKGLMKEDFLGLKDWADQINLYSSTNLTVLKPAYTAIKPLVPLNLRVETTLYRDPNLGMKVGLDLLKVPGLGESFAVPSSILEDNSQLTGLLS